MLPCARCIKPSGVRKYFFRFFKTHSRSCKYYRVLGIETSCDDTAAAVVDSDRNILGEAKVSQSDTHALHGGILPNFAVTLHNNYIKKVVDEALEKSNLTVKELDAIAVTVKPGILCNLLVGAEYAKNLCTLYTKNLIPIHHMQAHAMTIRLLENVKFPFLVLLISGGHCILALAESLVKFRVLGESSNITPGLLFDKISRRLKLSNLKEFRGLSGGVAMEKAAEEGNPLTLTFLGGNRPKRSCNFSFSGYENILKVYIKDEEKRLGIEGDQLLPNIYDICASIQYDLTKYISERVEIGINYLLECQTFEGKEKVLVVSGGVASNEFIRKMLTHVCDRYDFKLLVPPKSLCTDNGVMIAWNGVEKLKANLPSVPANELASVTCVPKCPLGETEPKAAEYRWRGSYVKLRNFIAQKSDKEESKNTLLVQDFIKN